MGNQAPEKRSANPEGSPNGPPQITHGLSVKFSDYQISANDGHVDYRICVRDSRTSDEWMIMSRFSALENVHKTLKKSNEGKALPEFPGKTMFSNSGPSFISRRQEALEHYFNLVLRNDSLTNIMPVLNLLSKKEIQEAKKISKNEEFNKIYEIFKEKPINERIIEEEKVDSHLNGIREDLRLETIVIYRSDIKWAPQLMMECPLDNEYYEPIDLSKEDINFIKNFWPSSFPSQKNEDEELDSSFNKVIYQTIYDVNKEDFYKMSSSHPFIFKLKKFLIDQLKRCQNFSSVRRFFMEFASSSETHRHFGKVSERNLITSLMMTLSARSRATLGKMLHKAGYAIPFAFCSLNSKDKLVQFVDFKVLYAEAICNSFDYPLVVNFGTTSAQSKGKTSILRYLFPINPEKLNLNEGFYLHSPGADLFFPTEELPYFLADVHGYSQNKKFQALLSSLILYSSFLVISVTKEDFVFATPNKGVGVGTPNKDLQDLLNLRTKFPTTRKIFLLMRDFNQSEHQNIIGSIQSNLNSFGKNIQIVPVINLAQTKKIDLELYITKFKDKFKEEIKPVTQEAGGFKSICQVSETFEAIYSGVYKEESENSVNLFDDLSAHFKNVDDKNVGEILFPLTTVLGKIEKCRDTIKDIRKQDQLTDIQMEKIRQQDNQIRILEEEKEKIRKINISECFNLALRIFLLNSWVDILIFEKFLEQWKKKFVNPKLKRREEIKMKILEAQSKTSKNSDIDKLNKQFQELTAEIDRANINPDQFWMEIMNLYQVNYDLPKSRPMVKAFDRLKQIYKYKLLEGYPVYLLRGEPLEIESVFLRDIFGELHAVQNIFVLSVIGMQSSAKSTLLNMLFGASFWTSAGRCTKGMFMSMVKIEPEIYLLILDTEGLMSIEGLGTDAKDAKFDAQMALMSFGMSNEVILNHKGEISRELQNLIEISLYAMKHLSVIEIKPTVYFVLRDQADRKEEKQKEALQALRMRLMASGKAVELHNISDYLNLEFDDLTMLPTAIIEDKSIDGSYFKKISDVFCDECFLLKKKLIGAIKMFFQRRVSDSTLKSFNSLSNFYLYATTLWTTLKTSRENLLNFKAIEEILKRKKIEEQAANILREFSEIMNDEITQMIADQVTEVERDLSKPFVDRLTDKIEVVYLTNKDSAEQKFAEFMKHEDNLSLKNEFLINIASILKRRKLNLLNDWNRKKAYLEDKKKNIEINSKIEESIVKILKKLEDCQDSEQQLESIIDRELTRLKEEKKSQIDKKYMSDSHILRDIVQIYNLVKHQNSQKDSYFILLDEIHCMTLQELVEATDLFKSKHIEEHNWYIKHNLSQKFFNLFKSSDPGEILAVIHIKIKNEILPRMIKRAFAEIRSFDSIYQTELNSAIFAAIDCLDQSDYSKKNRESLVNHNRFVKDVMLIILTEISRKYIQNSKNLREEEYQSFLKALMESKNRHLEIFRHRKNSHELGKKIASHYLENFLKNYEGYLTESLKSNLGNNVRNKMISERELYKRCFKASFEAKIWENVYKFVVNINLFMKEMFYRESEEFLSESRNAFEGSYRKFIKTSHQAFRDVLMAMPPETKNLKQFNEALSSSGLKEYLLFSTFSYEIQSWKEFREQFETRLHEFFSGINCNTVIIKFNKQLEKEIDAIFADLSGCPHRCPRCGGKCFIEGDHKDHKCEHLIPGFYGRRWHRTKKPNVEYCLAKKMYNCRYTKNDSNTVDEDDPNYDEKKVTWYLSLMEYINCKYPEWKVDFESHQFKEEIDPKEEVLKKAWVNARLPIIKMHQMRDEEEEWYQQYLDKDALPDSFEIAGYNDRPKTKKKNLR